MMDKDRVAAEAELLPHKLRLNDSGPGGLAATTRGREGLTAAFEQLTTELVRIATVSTPKKKKRTAMGAKHTGGLPR